MTTKEEIARDSEAYDIVTAGHVVRTDEGYNVTETGPGGATARVWRDVDGRVRCTCGEFLERASTDPAFRCAHIVAVKFHIAPDEIPAHARPHPMVSESYDAGALEEVEDCDGAPVTINGHPLLVSREAFARTLAALTEPVPAEYIKVKGRGDYAQPYLKGIYGIVLLNERAVDWSFELTFRPWLETITMPIVVDGNLFEYPVMSAHCAGALTIGGVRRDDVGFGAVGFVAPVRVSTLTPASDSSDAQNLRSWVGKVHAERSKGFKGAVTDCIKRCAHQFGLAIDLYLNPDAYKRLGQQGGGNRPAPPPRPAAPAQDDGAGILDQQKAAILALCGRQQITPERLGEMIAQKWAGKTIDTLNQGQAKTIIAGLQKAS